MDSTGRPSDVIGCWLGGLREAFWSAERRRKFRFHRSQHAFDHPQTPRGPSASASRSPLACARYPTPNKAELRASLRTPRRCAQRLRASRFLQVQGSDEAERLRLRRGCVWLLTRHGYAKRFGLRNKPWAFVGARTPSTVPRLPEATALQPHEVHRLSDSPPLRQSGASFLAPQSKALRATSPRLTVSPTPGLRCSRAASPEVGLCVAADSADYAQRFGVRNKPWAQFRLRRSQHAFDHVQTL
jgi:hypothetical protein